MGGTVVGRGERARIGAVDGDLIVDHDALIESATGGAVTVSGRCRFRGSATLRAPIECVGELKMESGTVVFEQGVRVGGSFRGDSVTAEVRGPLTAGDVDVGRALHVVGPAQARTFEVGGRFEADQSVEGERVSVGGQLRAKARVKAPRVDVGGHAGIETCELEHLSVGGRADLGGGRVAGSLEVGGQLDVARALEFGSIEVGGIARLAGGGKGGSIEVGGMFSSGADLTFEHLEVGGLGRLEGNVTGGDMEFGGLVDVGGWLHLSGRMEIGGRAVVGQELTVRDLEVGGEIRATRIEASGTVDVCGLLMTQGGTLAKQFIAGRRTEVRGPVTAQRVVLGRRCRAESIVAGTVILGPRSEVDRIVADDAEIGRACRIGSLQYVRTLNVAKGVEFRTPPVQVASRPVTA
jgi:cytoskeletal protein CcmA (bactofilin family)